MLDFYEMILNIKSWDIKDVITLIEKTIREETEDIYDVEGTCKVVTNNIYEKLSNLGIRTNIVNISDLYMELPDHQFLISSYRDLDNHFNYILIDPTYMQFLRQGRKNSPLYFSAWPSDILQNINPILLKNLLKEKYSYVGDKELQDYLKSFTNKNVNIKLETIILQKYDSRGRKR